ncbi:MAG: TPM domain-containing protein [Candidatus Omnitrophota bacterium]
MRRLASIFLILMICFGTVLSCGAQEVRFPSPVGFVNDYAGVLSPGAKSEIESLARRIEEKTTAEVVVVTVRSTAPLTIEQYAVELFQKWGIGKKGTDNGVLILVAVDDRKVRIEVGYGLEGAITDLQSKIIIEDLMTPAFKKGDFSLGVSAGVVMLAKLIRDEYGVDLDLGRREVAMPVRRRAKASPLGSFLTLLLDIRLPFWRLVFPDRRRRRLLVRRVFRVIRRGIRRFWRRNVRRRRRIRLLVVSSCHPERPNGVRKSRDLFKRR